ncbi:MAG: phosphonoacetaldehyde reductase [Lentisphaerae bacterium]|nr:phosphonoacetaldehyde reductase [Lentisphaerota bacterium]
MSKTHGLLAIETGQDIEGDLEEIGGLLKDLGCHRILLVADRAAYEQSGARAAMASLLSTYPTRILSDFDPNPDEADVQQAIAARKDFQPDTVIGLGGGTALDIAKLACVCDSRKNSLSAVVRGHVPPQYRDLKLIAIPTTAGTGSEATHFAAVYCGGVKRSVAHPSMLPDVAWLDPKLTRSLPPAVTAASGLDAICQAMESLWSVASTAESRRWASEALVIAWENLPVAVHHPNDAARAAMMRAAHLAGKSINISKTTACHAMSYALTSRHGVPHGAAVALTLAPVFLRIAGVTPETCCHPLGTPHVQGIVSQIIDTLQVSSPQDAANRIRDFIASLGCPTTLRSVGVTSAEEVHVLAAQVDADRLGNCPVKFSSGEIEKILHSVF